MSSDRRRAVASFIAGVALSTACVLSVTRLPADEPAQPSLFQKAQAIPSREHAGPTIQLELAGKHYLLDPLDKRWNLRGEERRQLKLAGKTDEDLERIEQERRDAGLAELRKANGALDPRKYEVAVIGTAPSESMSPGRVEIDRVTVPRDSDWQHVDLQLADDLTGPGTVRLIGELTCYDENGKTLTCGMAKPLEFAWSDVLKASKKLNWTLEPDVGDLAAGAAGSVAAIRVKATAPAEYIVRKGSFTREEASFVGTIPLRRPGDVQPGANADASGDVADFVQFSYDRRTYTHPKKEGGRSTVTADHILARATGQFEGLEVVYHRELWPTVASHGRVLYAGGLEAGLRDGSAEWTNAYQPAPERGNVVARAMGVVEWAPELGPVNRDLGRGLRFFVRGRGWADVAKDIDGDWGARARGFFDGEFFWNFSEKQRVYVRYERGSLPPDLTRTVERWSAGIGGAF